MATPFSPRIFPRRIFGLLRGIDATMAPLATTTITPGTSRVFAGRVFSQRVFPARVFTGETGTGGLFSPADLGEVDLNNLSSPSLLGTRYPHMRDLRIYLGNTHTVREQIRRLDVETATYVGVSGLGLTAYLADVPDAAAPIDAALSGEMAEETAGIYAVAFPIDPQGPLADYVDQTVYEIITDGGAFRVYNPALVVGVREGG